MAETIRPTVIVIDDDPSVRRSLKRLLRSEFLVEEFASATEFLAHGRPDGPACVILDVRMPHLSGPELFQRMMRGGWSLPVIFLTAHGDVPTSVFAMKHGAIDFLVKPADAEELLRSIHAALRRHAEDLAREQAQARLGSRLERLSPREREVMALVVRGEPNKRIAVELEISEKTVKVHRHRVMEKMEAGSLAELVRLAGALPTGTSTEPAASVAG